MRSIFSVPLALVILSFFIFECATPKKNYSLKETSPQLEKYEDTSLNPLLISPYSHSVFGIPVYDQFLEDSYRTIITVRFSQLAIQKMEESLTNKTDHSGKKEAFLFAYRELPVLQTRLETLHLKGLEHIAQVSMANAEAENVRDTLRNELVFTVEELQYMVKQVPSSVKRAKEIFPKVVPGTGKADSSSLTKLKIHNPYETQPLFLSRADDKCYLSREYSQWYILLGTYRLNHVALEELFPDPNQSYRFEEKVGVSDVLLSVVLGWATSITKKTIRIEACDSPLLADYRQLLEERDLYKTIIANKRETESTVAEAEIKEETEEPFYMKRVAMIQLTNGISVQGDIKAFSPDNISLEVDGEIRNLEKNQIEKIRYTKIKVRTDGKPF
ncbi:LIC_13076 family protein [Leptospira ilyithenensis]|nr:hypothetical protein [Leptospira ilyithenensis]